MTNQTGFPFNGDASLKDAALIYAREGFSIIPLHFLNRANQCSCGRSDCASPGKHPITQHGLKEASNDPLQIENWWKKFPKANIGLCTGDVSGGLVVIDFDLRHGATADKLVLPDTLRIETGNGFHLWFRSNRAIRNSAGKLGSGIDVRGSGGYVVAPPSVHFSGKVYQFANQFQVADLPEGLFVELEQEAAEEEIIVSDPNAIESEAAEGHRNDYLASLAGNLRRKGYSSEEIEALLLVSNQRRCKPPLADREVRAIARSVGRYAPAETLDFQVSEPVTPEQQAGQDSDSDFDPFAWDGGDKLLGAITAEQLSLTVFAKPEMVLQGLFRGDWGLMIGIGSVGKTTLMHNICMCLAAGRPFLPIVPEDLPPRRILYLDFESNPFRLQSQIAKLREWLTVQENQLVDQNLHFAIEPQTNGGPWRLTDRQSLQNLAKYIQTHKIDLVIVDTLAQAAALNDENSNSEVQNKVVTPIRRLVRHCDVAVLLLHHEGKGKTQTGENYLQYRARGASALMDAARYQITVVPKEKDKRDPVEVVNSKDKGEGFKPALMSLNPDTRWFGVVQPAQPSPPIRIEDALINCLSISGQDMSLQELCTYLPQYSKGAIRNALATLITDGQVIRPKWGFYRWADAIPETEFLDDDAPENDDLDQSA